MSAQGSSTPEFFSTHPSNENRIAEIKKCIEKLNANK
jgi:predicted Zn-dependent protease